MPTRKLSLAALVTSIFAAGVLAGALLQGARVAHAQQPLRLFEMRTYTAPDGKLNDLHARFRNHTTRLFQKHGMTNVGYWVPQDAERSKNTLIYILAYPNMEARKTSWANFQADPDWQKARTESEVNGRIVSRVDAVFMDPTDYSAMK